MATPSFAQSELNTSVSKKVQGTFAAADFLTIANDAAKFVMSDIDLRSMMRKSALSPNLFDEMYQYTLPSDIKGDKIIDIQPQINRGKFDDWVLTSQEQFDRLKSRTKLDVAGDPIKLAADEDWMGENYVAIARDDLVNKLLISRPISDTETLISSLDSLSAGGGTWTEYGDGDNATVDADNYVKGSASINWDINADGGTTAGVYNDDLDDFDVSDYKSNGSVFVWAYISSTTNLTNFILRIGSSSSAYYSITITTNNEGASFYAGWNLLRFDFTNKSTTGTPDDDACDYVALYMTKDAAKVSETDYRFDNLTMKLGEHYNVVYYTRYPWQSSAGTFLEDATTTTDLLNCETDEYPLFVLKTAEYMEEFLKHERLADRLEVKYERAKAKYVLENPSQALLMTNIYHNM